MRASPARFAPRGARQVGVEEAPGKSTVSGQARGRRRVFLKADDVMKGFRKYRRQAHTVRRELLFGPRVNRPALFRR